MAKQRWGDLAPRQRRLIIVAGAIQLVLAVTAWVDLARRPAARVRGPKPVWAVVAAANTVGSLAYFRWGRRRSGAAA
jgi:type II secretory pathway component PulM